MIATATPKTPNTNCEFVYRNTAINAAADTAISNNRPSSAPLNLAVRMYGAFQILVMRPRRRKRNVNETGPVGRSGPEKDSPSLA